MVRKSSILAVALVLLASYLISEAQSHSSGQTLATTKTTKSGCSCHCSKANSATTVTITKADTSTAYYVGSQYTFTITVTNTAQKAAGVDISAGSGTLAAGTGLALEKSSGELHHSAKKTMTDGQASWTFFYTPKKAGIDSIYATGNAVNNNGSEDPSCTDKWNWAASYPVNAVVNAVKEAPVAGNVQLLVHPNPAQSVATVTLSTDTLPTATPIAVTVYDNAGHAVYQNMMSYRSGATLRISTSHLPSGSYLVEAMAKGKMVGKTRLVVSH